MTRLADARGTSGVQQPLLDFARGISACEVAGETVAHDVPALCVHRCELGASASCRCDDLSDRELLGVAGTERTNAPDDPERSLDRSPG